MLDKKTIVTVAAIVLFADFSWSLVSSCPIYQSATVLSGDQNYCSLFNGFVFGLLLRKIALFLHAYEHELIAGFTIVLAFSTIFLWLSTRRLWKVTDNTLIHAEDTAKKELRAYLSVEPGGITRYLNRPEDGNQDVLGHFKIRNAGKIPARNVSIFSIIDWSEDGERTAFNHGTVVASPTVLHPRGKMQFGTSKRLDSRTIKPNPSKPQTRWLGYLYVWGRITYTDEFKTDGWTNFCHRYNCAMKPDSSSFDFPIEAARIHESGGNEAG